MLLAEERQERIIQYLKEKGTLRVAELALQFGVSRETIRRDLAELESKGLGKKIHGGVMLASTRAAEPSYAARAAAMVEEKRAIGAATARLVEDGESILLDLGTTTLEVAGHLRGKQNLTVLTNSVPAALALVDDPGVTVYLTGGHLRRGDLSLSGSRTREALGEVYVDKAIVGAGGLSVETGLTDYHVEEAFVRRLMIQRAKTAIVVADHTKFGVTAFAVVAPIQSIHHIVTDDGILDEDKKGLEAAGVQVTAVPVPSAGEEEAEGS